MFDVQNRARREASRPVLAAWLAVAAVALGIFTLMTSELLPVGLLTPVGSALNVSDGTAGLMVTVPGLVAAVSAPIVTMSAGRIDRRAVLAVLIAMVAAANLASAVATSFAVVLTARVLIGVAVGGFWAIAGGLALRLVPERHVGRATAVIFGGVSAASVLGVPAGTLIGELAGWRAAFAAVGMLALAALMCLLILLPQLPATQTVRPAALRALWLTNHGVRAGVLITVLLITGQFVAFTFARPILRDVAAIDGGHIGALLLGYGVAGLAGNFLAGHLAGRDVRRTVVTIGAAIAIVLVLMALAGHAPAGGAALLVAWGLAYGGVSVTLQTWMLTASPIAPEVATSLFVAAFNLSIAFGAFTGGVVIDGVSTTGLLWVAAAVIALASVVALRSRPAHQTPSPDRQGRSFTTS